MFVGRRSLFSSSSGFCRGSDATWRQIGRTGAPQIGRTGAPTNRGPTHVAQEVTARLSRTFASRKLDFRYVTVERQIFVTWRVTQYCRHSQKLQTSKHGQPHTIQILHALARDLTMGYAHRPAAYRASPGVKQWLWNLEVEVKSKVKYGLILSRWLCHWVHLLDFSSAFTCSYLFAFAWIKLRVFIYWFK